VKDWRQVLNHETKTGFINPVFVYGPTMTEERRAAADLDLHNLAKYYRGHPKVDDFF
jgi:hypothetical protein